MEKILKTTFLGTTKELPTAEQVEFQPSGVAEGCLFTFEYRSRTATYPQPLIIMISPKWVADKGGTYFNGVNLNDFPKKIKTKVINEFGNRRVGSVSFDEIKAFSEEDPTCCVRTYSVNKVRALHKVEV